jgi:cell division protein FtsW (lipid II flippase)
MVFFVTTIVFVMLVLWTKNMGIVLGYIAVVSFALYVYKGTWKYLPQ